MINMAWWSELDPNKKRWIAISGGVFILFVAVSLFSADSSDEKKPRNREDTIRHILTDKGTREAGIDALVGNIKTMKSENDRMRREIDRIKREQEESKSRNGSTVDIGKTVLQLKDDLQDLKKKNQQLEKDLVHVRRSPGASKPVGVGSGLDGAHESDLESDELKNPEEFFKDAALPKAKPEVSERSSGKPNTKVSGPANIKIVSLTEQSNSNKEESQSHGNEEEEMIYLPAGSILTGVTITGMDAPTSTGARKDPFPSTIRIQKEAILPNRFRADVRECFLIVSGYGDMSSERAYLRGESISCVRDDGAVIESRLDGYAVGEDGKAGVRGRLVSKQGAMVAKSMVAGFFGGVAQALDTNVVPTINTSPGTSPLYQDVFSENTLQSGLAKGSSSAMDRIAKFYLDMAENMFPVIEVDAGRQIDVIITKGQQLKLKSNGAKDA